MSLHWSYAGAETAMIAHREKKKAEYIGRWDFLTKEHLDSLPENEREELIESRRFHLEEWLVRFPWTDANGSGSEMWQVTSMEVSP